MDWLCSNITIIFYTTLSYTSKTQLGHCRIFSVVFIFFFAIHFSGEIEFETNAGKYEVTYSMCYRSRRHVHQIYRHRCYNHLRRETSVLHCTPVLGSYILQTPKIKWLLQCSHVLKSVCKTSKSYITIPAFFLDCFLKIFLRFDIIHLWHDIEGDLKIYSPEEIKFTQVNGRWE